MDVHDEKTRQILVAGGAAANGIRIRIPEYMVTRALDAIDEVGPTGSFLQHAHTLRHYKEPFYSTLFDKGPYSLWEKNGRLTLEDKAAKAVERILETHTVESLPEEVQEKIKAIVDRKQKWIDGNA